MHTEQSREKKRQRKLAKGLSSSAATPAMTPGHATPSTRRHSDPNTPVGDADANAEIVVDAERGQVILYERDWKYLGFRKRQVSEEVEIRPSWRDINPLPVMATIFAKPTNAIVLLSSGKFIRSKGKRLHVLTLSGILFAAQYTVTYTAALTLAA